MTASGNDELKSFLGGYFHEDWELDASNPNEAIIQFLNSGPDSSVIHRIVEQILRYIDISGDDASIEQSLVKEFGCYYLPSADGLSARDWLRHVVDKLADD